MKSRRQSRLRQLRRGGTSSNISTSYGGPVRVNTNAGQDSKAVRVNLTNTYSFNSDGSGNIAAAFPVSGVSGATDWANYANLYQEFRVMAMQFHYVPFYNGTYNSTVKPSAGAVATVHIPLSAAPASVDEVCQHATWKSIKTSSTLNQKWAMYGIEESTFIPTSTPSGVNHGGVILYIDTATASVRYGSVFVTYLVEFRGRQ